MDVFEFPGFKGQFQTLVEGHQLLKQVLSLMDVKIATSTGFLKVAEVALNNLSVGHTQSEWISFLKCFKLLSLLKRFFSIFF